jgi:hypothetical protein
MSLVEAYHACLEVLFIISQVIFDDRSSPLQLWQATLAIIKAIFWSSMSCPWKHTQSISSHSWNVMASLCHVSMFDSLARYVAHPLPDGFLLLLSSIWLDLINFFGNCNSFDKYINPSLSCGSGKFVAALWEEKVHSCLAYSLTVPIELFDVLLGKTEGSGCEFRCAIVFLDIWYDYER